MDIEREKRLAELAGIAVRVSLDTRVPKRLIVAQWAVESRWGSAPSGKANYFGIKRAARHAEFCLVTTHEYFSQAQIDHWNRAHPDRPARIESDLQGDGRRKVEIDDEFADYGSLEDSVRDYAWLISHGAPYSPAWLKYLASRDVDALIAGIAHAYSTSAEYAGMVTAISKQGNVTAALDTAALEAA